MIMELTANIIGSAFIEPRLLSTGGVGDDLRDAGLLRKSERGGVDGVFLPSLGDLEGHL